jgi:CheY-like chemotaxis protein
MNQHSIEENARRFRVFIAEDDQAQRALLVDLLRADGYIVIEASDGATLMINLVRFALESRGRTDDAFVICDIRMPGCNGLAVLRNILEHGGPCPPFAFMTAFPDPGVYEEARQLGVTRVLAKPFDIEDLRGLVREAAAASDTGAPPG